ncbi:prolipoprotein diacylglyceryl transferase [Tetragenococcus osmophilus]|uniref:Phosphatidylglycerol--prolipoprotein diacylglyceryl transferase n=1 Tax=Tetragenococcus osmophilus TaxID=526944 RepID=A0AA37XIK3_9ENTE|nr:MULTISPECIES: prolipoprotein diacylglyceryl transferase [Tetragenococcus]GMA45816.1 prolipoprotein diacylglyceryl transferase [Tetragenococcus muriaticus]GMA54922.1 prolipoprotein diacylglyceryl transferase [Alicyclobacillus contaminans]AYW46899.1 prolipoprotein diacylglyceryl transferase [Tetragenococcus osmophilus]GMA46814.1 prolipoprotein diacylglyceryl transferase [Tetragenococcus muriaticus]GMA71283.1 prolipoprotein diacylglyceryl transferase [Tetragenococcus osmophilus]
MTEGISRTAFEIFGIDIYWYAIIIVSGVIVAMWLSAREAERVGLKEDDVSDFMLAGLPIAFIGARLYYVLFNFEPYLNDPIQIFNLRSGGLAIYGGLIAGGLWLLFFCQRNFIPTWRFLDIAAPSVLIAQAIGRWGNFVNQEAYGPITTRSFLENLYIPDFIINNVYIEGAYRQPTFLYESVWSILGFILLLLLRRKKGLFKEGEVALSYVIWYSFGRFFIEGLRTDSLYLFSSIRISQLLSLVLFLASWAFLLWRRQRNAQLKDYDPTRGKNQFII